MSARKKFCLAILFFLLLCGSIAPQAQASSIPVPAVSQEFLYLGHISIKYREQQQGHPYTLLFIHGFGAGSHYWRELEEHFAGRYNTVALDLKGFGYSAKPKDGNYRLRDQADLVQAFIQAKNLSNVILVGHSLGGAVALLTSFQLPSDKVKGLILLDNAYFGQELPDFIRLLRTPVVNTVGPALLPDRFLVKQMLQKVFSDQTKITEAMIQQYAAYLKSPGAYYALRQTARQIIPDNVDEIIQQTIDLKIPVLIIWGEEDRILPLKNGRQLHENLKGSELIVIPGSGHSPHEEKPAETIQAITDFLTRRLPARLGDCQYPGQQLKSPAPL
jgi:pimeloyl-ACP methyl ester carboxylesterase